MEEARPNEDIVHELRRMIHEGVSGRRFTQSSPILPDVWMAFGLRPGIEHDLLLTPHFETGAGQLARHLREALLAEQRDNPRVAHMPGIVAASVGFAELIRVILPRTTWWRDLLKDLASAFPFESPEELRRLPALSEAGQRLIAGKIDALRNLATHAGTIVAKGQEVPLDFLWIVALAGWISLDEADRRAWNGATVARAFSELVHRRGAEGPSKGETTAQPSIFQVALNRTAESAASPAGTLGSAMAVKADAARRLFNLSCRDITWAIVDGGIDGGHPAFEDWAGDESASGHGDRKSRVVRTYDFTRVRDLLDPVRVTAALSDSSGEMSRRLQLNMVRDGLAPPEAAQEVGRLARELKLRLERGLEIDWGLMEPLLREDQPALPATNHGTLVAGLLGADWREGGGPGEGPQRIRMQGMCPDIRLLDLRVLEADGRINEFEVIAALQFIGHLNRRADMRIVHGVNLSLSVPHSVSNYACGSTLVCQACNALWGSGVVVVAAAGNRGHQRYRLASGEELEGYHAISITDPGNAEGAITVGATHRQAHQYGVSYFSSRGPTGDGRRKPDLVAPGEKVRGPVRNKAEGEDSGTSFATPHVSGGAALLMARFEELRGRPARIREILCSTATDLGREPYFQGAGMLDALRALQSI